MIAVTGANGLLGSFIVRKLLDVNEPFVAIVRKNSDTSVLDDVKARIQWRYADVLNPIELEDALDGVTKIIHAAAIVSFNPRRADEVMNINVNGTRNLVNESLAKGIRRFVYISSVAALGRQKNQRLIKEDNQWVDNPMNSVYARSKYMAELEVFRANEEGLSSVIINPSVILAPGNWNRSSGQLFKYVYSEKSFYTDAYLNYVDVRDVADLTYRLLASDISGERFIANAGKIHLRDFFNMVAKRFNRKAPTTKLNNGLLRLVARVEEVRTAIMGTEPVLTRETARLAGTDFLYNNEKIKKALPLEFQPIEASLDWCCDYYVKKYSRKK
jgi:dihydroflavonol-4-reductase